MKVRELILNVSIVLLGMFSMFVKAESAKHDYVLEGKTYEGYYLPAKENAPLVLIVHDWDGLTDYEVRRSEMLSELGYSVFAADLFGKGIRPTEVKDKKQHTGELYQDREKMRFLLNGALAEAKKLGANIENAIAIGYCFGGAAVLELARSGANLKGFASFHGGLKTPVGQHYQDAKGKLLIMHGTADTMISMDEFAALAKELEEAKVPHQMTSFGGAQHAFTVFDSDRYDSKADQASWRELIHFIKEQTAH